MTRAHPLPPPLRGRPFTIAEAAALGLTVSRLRASDLEAPTRGVRITSVPTAVGADLRDGAALERPPGAPREAASERMERLRADLLLRTEQYAPALTPAQYYSHETALAVLGAPGRAGVIGHRLTQRSDARWVSNGLPIEHPARAWRQAASSWQLDDLIAAAEFLICPRRKLLTLADLRREIEEAGDVPGRRLARALDEARVGAETAEETATRLLIQRAGLPEPDLNWELRAADGTFIARLDLAYPRYKVAIEHDGRIHAFDEAQFARDADRWDAIRAARWTHVRILSHHLRPDPQVAVRKVAEALIAAGWHPGS